MAYYRSQRKGTNPMDKLNQLSSRLIYIAATVAAVVVGVLQFLYRAWHSNDAGTKLKTVIYRVFSVIQSVSSAITNEFEPNPNQTSVRDDELGTVLEGGLPEDSDL